MKVTTNMELNQLVKKCHKIAIEKGWWDDNRTYPEVMMMVITEIAESVQEDRSGNTIKRNEEIADVLIRLFDLIGYLNINIESEVYKKMEINEKRRYKHGKRY